MNQLALLTTTDISQKVVCLDTIKATFMPGTGNACDVILEINSNKFLIAIQHVADAIESFEIITAKGFIELSNNIILTLKKLIEHLRYRI